jgi:hypothetical protein
MGRETHLGCEQFKVVTVGTIALGGEVMGRETHLGCEQFKVVTVGSVQLSIGCQTDSPLDCLHGAQLVKVGASKQHGCCDVGHILDGARLVEGVLGSVGCSRKILPTTLKHAHTHARGNKQCQGHGVTL